MTSNTDNIDNNKTTAKYIPLIDHDDYEILNEYPFTIRRKKDSYEISEFKNGKGYIGVKLNGNKHYKHILVAKQFIENDDPDHKTQVDHINHDRTDYHIENLRWITPSNNQRNKSVHNGI